MAKKKEAQVEVVETEDMKVKFQEKLVGILALGKKKKNILEYQEINDFFRYATEGYNRCEWEYFLSIIEKFNNLVCKVTDAYV